MDRSPAVLYKRKELYKAKTSTPPWKDTYRKRCQERLKSSRDKFLERFRCGLQAADSTTQGSVVNDLMMEEWKILRAEQQGLPTIADGSENSSMEKDDIDDVLSVFEEIRTELIREEQQILMEYEAGLRFDDATMCSSMHNLGPDDVLCPVCQRNPLMINKGVIFCHCGIRLDTEQDCISLEYIRQNMADGLEQHKSHCPSMPKYSVINQVGVDNMLMTCPVCDFMFIIA